MPTASNPRWFSPQDSILTRSLLTFVLKAAVSGILLYFDFAHVKFDLIGQRLDHLRYSWLTLAILILIAQIPVGALRWQTIVRHCDSPDTSRFALSSALRFTFIAAFFNQTLPS